MDRYDQPCLCRSYGYQEPPVVNLYELALGQMASWILQLTIG